MKGKIFIICVLFTFITGTLRAQPGIGKPSPEISLEDRNGIIQRLSDNKGRVVLIDFWASWCGPCRRSNRELTSLYERYKNKGFEIFAISIDQNKEDWKRAILADKIKWKQVIERGGWDAPVALTWGIEQIPSSFLLDKEGIIIAINPTKKEIERYLKKAVL